MYIYSFFYVYNPTDQAAIQKLMVFAALIYLQNFKHLELLELLRTLYMGE
jgi:hypothetical protein